VRVTDDPFCDLAASWCPSCNRFRDEAHGPGDCDELADVFGASVLDDDDLRIAREDLTACRVVAAGFDPRVVLDSRYRKLPVSDGGRWFIDQRAGRHFLGQLDLLGLGVVEA
jgi:hypothetical protein